MFSLQLTVGIGRQFVHVSIPDYVYLVIRKVKRVLLMTALPV